MSATTLDTPTVPIPVIRLATLEREEAQARRLHDDALRIVGNIPEGEATDEHLDYVTGAYMAWVRAWETLAAARRELAKKD